MDFVNKLKPMLRRITTSGCISSANNCTVLLKKSVLDEKEERCTIAGSNLIMIGLLMREIEYY
jgi:hypothetical protein